MTGYRIIWRCAVAAVSAAGALLAVILLAPTTMIAVFVSSALVTSLATATYLALREEKQGSHLLRRYGRNALLGGAAGVAATGLAEVVGGFAILVVLVAIAASPPAVRWYAVWLGEHRVDKPTATYPEAKRHHSLSIEELCTAWTQSCLDLRGATPAQALRFVQARQYYLDELERRDPDGLRAWLATAASASGSPRRFISRRADS